MTDASFIIWEKSLDIKSINNLNLFYEIGISKKMKYHDFIKLEKNKNSDIIDPFMESLIKDNLLYKGEKQVNILFHKEN